MCVVLTTHELAEAEKMADRIVIMSRPHRAGGHARDLSRSTAPARQRPRDLRRPARPRTAALAGAVGPGDRRHRDRTGALPGRGRRASALRPSRRRSPRISPSDGATLTDLVAGRTLEDVYFEAVGAATPRAGRTGPSRRSTGRGGWRGRDGGRGDEQRPACCAPLTAQTGVEFFMTLRRGETLLLTLGIPVVFLLFFSKVSVVSTPTATPADFFVPGILALAVMSTAMVSLGIATGFERGYGVLKRLGSTPLGRPRLLGAKVVTIVAVEMLQAAVLLPVGLALGWNPGGVAPPAVPGRWARWCSAPPPLPVSACSWPGPCGPR